MAAALLQQHLHNGGATADVRSAGIFSGGSPAVPEVAELLDGRGIDVSDHRSRRIEPAMLDDADLVLGMTREHVREVCALSPAAWPRAFTLKEGVRRAQLMGRRPEGTDLRSWLERMGTARRPADLLGSSAEDDVEDPMGGRRSAFRDTLAELEALIQSLVDLLALDRP